MDSKCLTLFLLLSQHKIAHSAHGSITKNITFFYPKLPVAPSIGALIEFSVSYRQCSMRHAEYYPLMGIYTTYPEINIAKQCSYIRYGQLRNENLHPHLKVGTYRTTTCELSGADTVNCSGRVNIQDYTPRSFYLSFGFYCDWPQIHFLPGLEYNISFTQQSNETSGCIYYSVGYQSAMCDKLFAQTYLPNLIGDETLDQVLEYHIRFRRFQGLIAIDGTCHQHFLEAVCYISLPKCDPVTKQVTHPCKEMCRDIVDGCWKKWFHLVAKMEPGFSLSRRFKLDHVSSIDTHQLINCDYLPSHHGSIPCFYKPVTCDSPPDVTSGAAILNVTQKDIYGLHDVIQYACLNETLKMVGNNSVVCLHSGEWSTLPKCEVVKEVKNSVMNPVYVVVPVLFVPLIILILIGGMKCRTKTSPDLTEEKIKLDNTLAQLADSDEPLLPSKRKQESTLSLDSPPLLKRNREYDAFVLFHFDTDNDFIISVIIPELKEARHLRLLHSHDFQPGRKIAENIEGAIKSSNNAIILMSAGFTKSEWCRDEFDHWYIEHVEDPAFKLFVIMMEPREDLSHITPYMKKVLAEETYLEIDDLNLFTKLAKCLKPENDADASDNDLCIEHCDKA